MRGGTGVGRRRRGRCSFENSIGWLRSGLEKPWCLLLTPPRVTGERRGCVSRGAEVIEKSRKIFRLGRSPAGAGEGTISENVRWGSQPGGRGCAISANGK